MGIEVLDDLVSFFECSPAFISVPCEKLRRTQGPNFNKKIVNALMSLRSEMDKNDKKEALATCYDIIETYKETDCNPSQVRDKLAQGNLFAQLDTTAAE